MQWAFPGEAQGRLTLESTHQRRFTQGLFGKRSEKTFENEFIPREEGITSKLVN